MEKSDKNFKINIFRILESTIEQHSFKKKEITKAKQA